MKKHTKVTFTRKILKKYNPCSDGLAAALEFLPAKISTDPEQNIALALELAESPRALEHDADVTWLLNAVCENAETVCCRHCTPDYEPPDGSEGKDAMVIAQYLAIIADKLATDAGR